MTLRNAARPLADVAAGPLELGWKVVGTRGLKMGDRYRHAERREGPVVRVAYISRHIPLNSSEAVRAADAWHRGLAPIGLRGRRLSATHQLQLRRRFEAAGGDLRQAQGILRVRGVPVPVELELATCSEHVTELAVHSFDLRWPVGTKRYEQLAWGVVDVIGDIIMTLARATAHEEADPGTVERVPVQDAAVFLPQSDCRLVRR